MDTATFWAFIGLGLGNLLTFVTILLKRKWEVEDRIALAAQVVNTATALATSVEQTSTALASKVEAQAMVTQGLLRDTHEEIKANTKISTDAFHEANGAKLLLAEEVRRRNEMQAASQQRREDRTGTD